VRLWMRSDTQCRCRRVVGEGAAAARKLGDGGHGGSALACARRGRVPGRARASAGCQGSSGVRIWSRREQGGAWRGVRTRVGNGGRALLHG